MRRLRRSYERRLRTQLGGSLESRADPSGEVPPTSPLGVPPVSRTDGSGEALTVSQIGVRKEKRAAGFARYEALHTQRISWIVVPLMLAEVAAVVMLWVAVFFVVAVLGRLLLKKIRGKGLDDNLDEGAEAVADAIGGDTSKGPMTLLTDPIASKRGMFYWSDKIFGAGLGLLKGVVTGYLLFALVLYTFLGLAIVCDEYFCESLEQISSALSPVLMCSAAGLGALAALRRRRSALHNG